MNYAATRQRFNATNEGRSVLPRPRFLSCRIEEEKEKEDEDENRHHPLASGRVALRLLIGLLFCASAWSGFADTLRVTSWHLQPLNAGGAGQTNDSIQQWSATLARLNPDVILLQGVNDWQMCAQLVQALKPAEFNIAICSSFRPAQGQSGGPQQVAILSKPKAYFSWSEAWPGTGENAGQGGFAFAALQAGKTRVGFFCGGFNNGLGPEVQVRPILEQLDAVKRWEANQVQSFVVAASFGSSGKSPVPAAETTVRLLEEAGFVDALMQLPARQRITLAPGPGQPGAATDYLLIEPSVFPNPQIVSAVGSGHYPVTCDLELDLAKATVAWTERARQAELVSQAQAAREQEKRARQDKVAPGEHQAAPEAHSPRSRSLAVRVAEAGPAWLAAMVGIVIALVALVVALAKNRRRPVRAPVLIPENVESAGRPAASFTLVVAPRSATGSGPEPLPRGSDSPPMIQLESSGTQTQSASWQQRALKAEASAERAQAIVRQGVLPHLRRWLKQKLVRKLADDRARLLETQQAATRKVLSVDERLSRIEAQLQQQNRAYERRIEELTCELVAAKEENRELIRARIAQVKAEMETARARLLAQAETPDSEA